MPPLIQAAPFLCLASLALAFAPLCPAQTVVNVNWGSGAQNISADTDVSTSGTLVQATNLGFFGELWTNILGTTSTTLNGVTFSGVDLESLGQVQSLTAGNFTLSESPNYLAGSGGSTPDQALGSPAGNLSYAYRQLLMAGASTTTGERREETMRLTMPNLTLGNTYQFQWWTNYSQWGEGHLYTSATGGLTLDANTLGASGGLGQFAVGTFTATDTSMYVEFNGVGNVPLINAFELRNLTTVPEPSTYAVVAGFAALALAAIRRTRRRVTDGTENPRA